jgi:dTDP-4-amino-4,6-dideoxygalactose transaminase
VLASGVLSGFIASPGEAFFGGPEVRALEEEWAELGTYAGVVAVNSATAALHAGIVAMDLPPASEIVVPPFTMSATVSAVLMAGLRPRFADVDPELFTLTADTIRPVLNPRTSAILVVHLFGQLAPMGPIRELADQHGLGILEDNAQAPGATQGGLWPGTGTSGAVFSFNQHKTITCGEGGLLASQHATVLQRGRLVRNHAEAVIHGFPDVDPVGFIGWNYRLTEVEAAIARAQTAKLSLLTEHRTSLAAHLHQRLVGVPGLQPPVVLVGNRHVYFTFALRFDSNLWGCSRAQFVDALAAEGIPCAAGYVPPLYGLPVFGSQFEAEREPSNFPTCERLANKELVLLNVCRWPATHEDIDDVADAIEKCWSQRGELAKQLTAPG